MIRQQPSSPPAGTGRLATGAAWLFAVCCLPYLVLKVAWTFDVPLGVTDRAVLDSSGWMAANALMAVVQLAGLLLVLALVRPWARHLPAWLLLAPVWVGTGLLFLVTGAALVGLVSAPARSGGEADLGGFQPWVFVVVYAGFAGQGAALAIAFVCHVRTRWGRLLGARTVDLLGTRTSQARSWPQAHRTGLIEVVAGILVVLALVSFYWAAGGSFGLSEPLPAREMQAAGGLGALTAALGLLGLAGRWGRTAKLWLPSALTWVGSGAVVAFDALTLALGRLFDAGGTGWTSTDTGRLTKVAVGVSAAALGALVVTTAREELRERRLLHVPS